MITTTQQVNQCYDQSNAWEYATTLLLCSKHKADDYNNVHYYIWVQKNKFHYRVEHAYATVHCRYRCQIDQIKEPISQM